jgi:hypothetical protein
MFRYFPASVEAESHRDHLRTSGFFSRFASRLYELDQSAAVRGWSFAVEKIVPTLPRPDEQHAYVEVDGDEMPLFENQPIIPPIAEPIYTEGQASAVIRGRESGEEKIVCKGASQGWEVVNSIRAAENNDIIETLFLSALDPYGQPCSFTLANSMPRIGRMVDPVEFAELVVLAVRKHIPMFPCAIVIFELYKERQLTTARQYLSPEPVVEKVWVAPARKKNECRRRYRNRIEGWQARAKPRLVRVPQPQVLLLDLTRIVCSYLALDA